MVVYSHALFNGRDCLRPLDRAHGADNLLIFEGRTAAHAVPLMHADIDESAERRHVRHGCGIERPRMIAIP